MCVIASEKNNNSEYANEENEAKRTSQPSTLSFLMYFNKMNKESDVHRSVSNIFQIFNLRLNSTKMKFGKNMKRPMESCTFLEKNLNYLLH